MAKNTTIQISKCNECGWELHSTIRAKKTYDIVNKAGIKHTIARFESGILKVLNCEKASYRDGRIYRW